MAIVAEHIGARGYRPSIASAAMSDSGTDVEIAPSRSKLVLRIAIRVLVVVLAVAVGGIALFNIFDDLDPSEVRSALGELSDAEWLSLLFGWLIWVGCQGLQTASLVDRLPARRGVQASLGPTAVSSVIPGPSDLPVRYSMYQSWGVSSTEAATAVAASGIFSIGSQLGLPAIAGLIILVTDVAVDGFASIIAAAAVVLFVLVAFAVFVLGSSDRTAWVGHKLDPLWRLGHRILRRVPPDDAELADFLVTHRATALDHIGDKWVATSAATVITIAAKCSLLVLSLRFVGIPEDALGWSAIFVVYSLVAGLTVIPITPGSAGVTEVALIGMLTPIAGTAYVNEVAAGVLIYRLLTWILIIPVGFGVLGAWRYNLRRARSRDDGAEPRAGSAS